MKNFKGYLSSIINMMNSSRKATIKKIATKVPNTELFNVEAPDLLENTFIFTNQDALEIQFNPWLTSNSGLGEYALRSTETFLKVFFEHQQDELQHIDPECFCNITPLSGSTYYHMGDAFYHVFRRAIPQVFIGVRKNFRDGHWVGDISYKNIDSLPENPYLILGNVIATGSTLFSVLHEIKREVEHIQGIVIYSIAGGLPGIRLLKKMEKIFGGTKINLYAANAIFGLMDNGTDMPWLHPETITTPELRQKAIDNFGPYLAEKWCTIFDWGKRCNLSEKHLDELEDTINRYLGNEIDNLTKIKLESFLEKVKIEKAKISSPLQIEEK